MKDNKAFIENITGFISIILGTHYFLSFRWFYGLLKIWEIESLAVISLEDLTFPYAHLNISIIAFSSIGFLGVFWWKLVSNKNSNPSEDLKNRIVSFKDFFSKQNLWIKILLVSILISSLIFIYFYAFESLFSHENKGLWFAYLFILLVMPILYVFISDKRNLIFGLQLFSMFVWANFFINNILDGIKPPNPKNDIKTKVSFEYKGESFKSSKNLLFLHHGHKYLIMKDSTGASILYQSNLVDKFTYKRISN